MLNHYLKKFPIDDLRYYAHSNPTEEVCGVCLKDRTFIPAPNLASERSSSFLFDRKLIDENEGEVLAIFHSHVLESDGSVFSPHDIEVSRTLQIPYLLYGLDDGWDYFDPMGIHPYPLEEVGSPEDPSYFTLWRFSYGRADCATSIRSWILWKLGIRLADYNRVDFEAVMEHNVHQFGEGRWRENGFEILHKDTPLKDNDIIAISLTGGLQANHLAVITSAENNEMLHNLGQERFSEIITYNNSWRLRTLHIARHISQC